MPRVFPDYPAPVVRNVGSDRELAAEVRRAASHQHPQHLVAVLARLVEAGEPMSGAGQQLLRSTRQSRTR
jgi:hypothetical protein